jgi:hypothetical protein
MSARKSTRAERMSAHADVVIAAPHRFIGRGVAQSRDECGGRKTGQYAVGTRSERVSGGGGRSTPEWLGIQLASDGRSGCRPQCPPCATPAFPAFRPVSLARSRFGPGPFLEAGLCKLQNDFGRWYRRCCAHNGRDREFADSPLEEAVMSELVSEARIPLLAAN